MASWAGLSSPISWDMIRNPERLNDFEIWHAREHLARLSHADALAIFTALWRHAQALDPAFPERWRDDLRADLELARVLNGLVAES